MSEPGQASQKPNLFVPVLEDIDLAEDRFGDDLDVALLGVGRPQFFQEIQRLFIDDLGAVAR
jgi:hypothetical protein